MKTVFVVTSFEEGYCDDFKGVFDDLDLALDFAKRYDYDVIECVLNDTERNEVELFNGSVAASKRYAQEHKDRMENKNVHEV
jgi:hypothetical protein